MISSQYEKRPPTCLWNLSKVYCSFMCPGKLVKICIFQSFHRLQVVKSVNVNKLLILKKCLKSIDFVLDLWYNLDSGSSISSLHRSLINRYCTTLEEVTCWQVILRPWVYWYIQQRFIRSQKLPFEPIQEKLYFARAY